MTKEPFPAELVDAVAIALFDAEEKLFQEVIAELDAKGSTSIGNVLGHEPGGWHDPANEHEHAGFRRRATAALLAHAEFMRGAQ